MSKQCRFNRYGFSGPILSHGNEALLQAFVVAVAINESNERFLFLRVAICWICVFLVLVCLTVQRHKKEKLIVSYAEYIDVTNS